MEAVTGIKMVLLDVDGVLTDGSIIMDDRGTESKKFNARDGLGIFLLHAAEVKVGIISGRTAEVVAQRARQLKIDELHQGVEHKLEVYERILARNMLRDREVCFVGDDLIDLPVMRRVGLAAAPADAHPLVREQAAIVTAAAGGRGCVREIAEAVLRGNGQWERVVRRYFS